MAKKSENGTDILGPDYIARVRLLRHIFAGENQTVFAKKMGISVARWNNCERGLRLSLNMANILYEKIEGFSLNWLYYGLNDLREPLRTKVNTERRKTDAAIADRREQGRRPKVGRPRTKD
jgi:hypothetical protein